MGNFPTHPEVVASFSEETCEKEEQPQERASIVPEYGQDTSRIDGLIQKSFQGTPRIRTEDHETLEVFWHLL